MHLPDSLANTSNLIENYFRRRQKRFCEKSQSLFLTDAPSYGALLLSKLKTDKENWACSKPIAIFNR